MPITLTEARTASTDDIQVGVIDEFRKSSFLLDSLIFDDAVTPGTNGATLTYGYTRQITQPTAAFRAFNAEYVPSTVTTQRYTTDLRPFGGSFQVDRVLAKVSGLYSHIELQLTQKIKAARTLAHDTIINGDSAVDANSFDGLNKALTGSTTELNATLAALAIDLSTDAAMDANKHKLLDVLDELVHSLDGTASFLGMNTKLLLKIRSVARRAGFWRQEKNSFGQSVEFYGDVPMINLGEKPGSANPVIPIVTRDLDGAGANAAVTGLTDLYAVRLGLDGFHGVSLANTPLVQTWLPDFTTSGAVKSGEVEMVASVALKATKAAAVYRNFKVQ